MVSQFYVAFQGRCILRKHRNLSAKFLDFNFPIFLWWIHVEFTEQPKERESYTDPAYYYHKFHTLRGTNMVDIQIWKGLWRHVKTKNMMM